jgi:hypothetical protein
MTTFLWMLYLTFTLYVSISTISQVLQMAINWKELSFETSKTIIITSFVTSLLWSIWYFYYLH